MYNEPVKPVNQHASKSPVHPISSDKKYNIVLFGMDECRVGISRRDRFHSDLSSAVRLWNSFPVIDLTVSVRSIKKFLFDHLWEHFTANFNSDVACSFHFSCPHCKLYNGL